MASADYRDKLTSGSVRLEREVNLLSNVTSVQVMDSSYCSVVIYAKTVDALKSSATERRKDERNFNCSTDIWKGRVKVVRRRRTTQTPNLFADELRYNDAESSQNDPDSVRLSTRRRYWSLTTRLRHRAGVSRR